MFQRRFLFSLLAAFPLAAASMACAVEEEEAVSGDEDSAIEQELQNAEKNGKPSSQWIYSGLMPSLEKPSVVTSLSAHTVRVTGLLPKTFTGQLPYYANRGSIVDGQQQVFVVYPVASGAVNPVTNTAPAGPGDYTGLRISPFVPTTDKAPWGGFPFMAYNRSRGLAFHGPITSVAGGDDPADYEWRLIRGKVSHGCQRMQGEHVVEMAHLLGVDMSKPHRATEMYNNTSFNVHVSFDVDVSPEGKKVDVNYPAGPGVTRPTGSDARIYPTWDSRDFPNIVCAYSAARPITANYCAAAGKPRKDILTGAAFVTPPSGPFVGTACTSNADCAFSAGGKSGTCKKGATGGFCTISCAGTCPDKAGYAPTFCGTDGSAGICEAKVDTLNKSCASLPGTAPKLVDRFVTGTSVKAAQASVCALK